MVVAFALNKDGLNIEVLVAISSFNKFLVPSVLSFVFEVAVTLLVAVVEVVPVVAVVPVVPVVTVVPVVPAISVVKNFFTAEDNLGGDDELENEEPAAAFRVDETVSVVAKASTVAVAAASVVLVSGSILVVKDVYGDVSLARYLSQLRSSSSIIE